MNFAGPTIYDPGSRSVMADVLLLRGRVIEGSIYRLTDGTDITPQCFGYAILTGLHGSPVGTANFIERWTDNEGNPVLSVTVQYHKTLQDIGFATNKETSK